MWGKNVAFVVIRPTRYTKEFVDAADTFSLAFLDESYRKTLNYFGTVSGRDEDKIKASGLRRALCLYAASYMPRNTTRTVSSTGNRMGNGILKRITIRCISQKSQKRSKSKSRNIEKAAAVIFYAAAFFAFSSFRLPLPIIPLSFQGILGFPDASFETILSSADVKFTINAVNAAIYGHSQILYRIRMEL